MVTAGGMLLQQVLGFVGGVFVAKLLGPADYGQVSVLRSLLQMVIVFTPLGLDLALFRILPKFDHQPAIQALYFRRFRLIVLGFGLALVAITSLVAGPLLARHVYAYDHFAFYLALTMFAIPFATDVLLMNAWYRVQGDIIPILLITSYFQPVVRTVLNVLAVYWGFGVFGVVVGTTVAYLASFLLAVPYYQWTVRGVYRDTSTAVPSWHRTWNLFREAPPMAINMFAYTMMRTADISIVGAIAPARAVGEYAVVSNIAQLVPIAALSLIQTLGPKIARLHQAGDRAGIARELNSTIRWACLLSSFVFGGIAGFGSHLDAVFGHAYHPGQIIVILIPLGYLASGTVAPTSYALTMGGRSKADLFCLTVASCVLVATCIPLTWLLGTLGAAIAVLIGFTTISVMRFCYLRQELGAWLGSWADLLPPVVALGLAMGINHVLLPAKATLPALFGACLVYTAAYVALMLRQPAALILARLRGRKRRAA
jgi:O-antigen/teichoic acid export membrane protein